MRSGDAAEAWEAWYVPTTTASWGNDAPFARNHAMASNFSSISFALARGIFK